MKKQLKDLGVSDSSSDEESAKAKALKEGAQTRRLKLQKYDHGKIEDQIDRILLYRDLLLDKREQRKKPTEDYETFMNRSKESVEVSDPFGYIYDILYNSHSDNFFYNKGNLCFIRYQPKELQTRLLQ